MKLSIIVPVYKGIKKLSKFLEQLSNQTSSDYELILVIDTLKEDALKEVDSFLADYPSVKENFKLAFNSKRTGRTSAINDGILMATGDYTVLMSNTDSFEKTFVATAIQIINKHKSDIIEFNASIKSPIKFEGVVRKICKPETVIDENADIFAFTYAFDFNKFYKTNILKRTAQFLFTSSINSRYSIELVFKALTVAHTYSSVNKNLIAYKSEISENFNPLKQIRQWKSANAFIVKNLENKYYSEWIYNFLFTQTQFTFRMVEKAKSKVLTSKYCADLVAEIHAINLNANPYLLQKTEETTSIGQVVENL